MNKSLNLRINKGFVGMEAGWFFKRQVYWNLVDLKSTLKYMFRRGETHSFTMWFVSFSLIFGCSKKTTPQIYHFMKQSINHIPVRPEVGKFEQPGDVTSSWLGGTGWVGWHTVWRRGFLETSWCHNGGRLERILLNYLGDICTFRQKPAVFSCGFY